MYINWFGQSFFKIQGDKSILVTDPFDKDIGLKVPRPTANILLLSRDNAEQADSIKGASSDRPFIINGPGEYESKDTFVYGIPVEKKSTEGAKDKNKISSATTIYRIEIDGIAIAYLGNLGEMLQNGQTEKLEGVDILLIPVGGGDVLDAKQATELISQLEPRIVIPTHYRLKGLKADVDPLDKFCKEIGVCPTGSLNKFKVTKKDLPQEEMKIIILEP